MNSQKDLATFVGTIVVAAALAGSANLWVPMLLQFVGTNAQLIQGLTALIQIILWFGILLFFLLKLYFKIKSNSASRSTDTLSNHPGNQSNATGNTAAQFVNQADTINGLTQGNNNQVNNNFK